MPIKKKRDEQLNKKKIKFINNLSLLMGFSNAVLVYILSSYLGAASGYKNVGIYYFFSYLVVLWSLFHLHRTIKRFGKSKVYLSAMGMEILSLFCLVILPPSGWSILFLMTYIISINLVWVCLDIILESYSVDNKSGRIRGFYLMMMNLGFIFGPFISTQILQNMDYQAVFLVALAIDSLVLYLSYRNLSNVNHKSKADLSAVRLLKKIWKRKNILRIYYIAFILEFFYATMIIYSPVYMRDIGISWPEIGLIFTIMLTPFVFMPYPMGYLADKKLGEKELLVIAIFIMGVSVCWIPLIADANFILWAAVLFMTRIGASTIDTLRDSYFYKRIDGRDVDIIDFFRTATSAAYIAASIFTFAVLMFFSVKVVFVLLSAIIFSALYPALRLADNKSEAELNAEKLIIMNLALK